MSTTPRTDALWDSYAPLADLKKLSCTLELDLQQAVAALKEIQIISNESNAEFRKRGGTRWGLMGIVAKEALAKLEVAP